MMREGTYVRPTTGIHRNRVGIVEATVAGYKRLVAFGDKGCFIGEGLYHVEKLIPEPYPKREELMTTVVEAAPQTQWERPSD